MLRCILKGTVVCIVISKTFHDLSVNFRRHYCDVKGWLQPTIKALGADGLPFVPTDTLPAVQPTTGTSDIETEIEVEHEEEEEELLSSGEVVLAGELD